MKMPRVIALSTLTVVAGLALAYTSATHRDASAAAPVLAAARGDVDIEAVAAKLVNDAARVQEGELVLISGGPRDLALLEAVAVHVRKAGAHPLVTLVSERMIRRMYDDVPAKYDAQPPGWDLELAELADVSINVDFVEQEGYLAGVPAERMTAANAAFAPVAVAFLKRNVRQVNLGNGLYPTQGLAQRYGMTQEDLSGIFWGGVNVDYAQLQSRGQAVKAALEGGRELRITNPNGTDLKVRIEGRPVFMSDGIVSAEDARLGGPASQVWLPAGEVFLAPVPGTAQGKVVVGRSFFQGKEIRDLTLTFEDGRVTSMSAASGLEGLKALYDAAGAGKDEFGLVDLGINPNVTIPPGGRLTAWMPAGMVTVGIGANTWAGGENTSAFGWTGFLPGSTLAVDGKAVVEGGKLTL